MLQNVHLRRLNRPEHYERMVLAAPAVVRGTAALLGHLDRLDLTSTGMRTCWPGRLRFMAVTGRATQRVQEDTEYP